MSSDRAAHTHAGSGDVPAREPVREGARKAKRATMRDVADRAGVSLMTVSRVLNDTATVKPATRSRVETAVRELNYRPNLGARHLAGGRSLFIGLLYRNPSPGYLSQILSGSLEACRKFGHHLVLEDLGRRDPHSEPVETVASLNLSGLDALIVTPPLSAIRPFVAELEKLGVPIVRFAPAKMSGEGLRVAMDDVGAMREIVNLIVERGHRRIAFVLGPEDHAATRHRARGFEAAVAEHGLDVPQHWLQRGSFTYRSGFEAGMALLGADDRPTAVIASNDDMAAGVMAAAFRLGLSVPEDVSVTGFDDTEIASNMLPALTTIRQPIAEMATRAVELLDASRDGDAEDAAREGGILAHTLVERGSVAPPPEG